MASSNEHVADIEKGLASDAENSRLESPTEKKPRGEHDAAIDIDDSVSSDNIVLQWTKRVEHFLGLEARGIHRVKPNEQSPKTTLSFLQIVVLWFSINTASQNITLASIGQSVYGLGFVDATLASVFGAFLGSIPVAYTAGWGPWSGNRTMVGRNLPRTARTCTDGVRYVPASQWDGGLSRYVFCSIWSSLSDMR